MDEPPGHQNTNRARKTRPAQQQRGPSSATIEYIASKIGPEPGPLNWRDHSLCAQTDPEAFFPEKGGSTREAKRVCRACPVRVECLEDALARDERFGIWGGFSERERRRLKKEQAA